MPKLKRQDPLARRNRANKNRGREFENRCAASLGWTRVPYSGAQKDWGAGDVVDRFYERDGKWMAECKIMIGQKTGLSIKGKWIKQMHRDLGERKPILFFARKGSPRAWVLLPEISNRLLTDGMCLMFCNATVQATELGTFLIKQETLDEVWNSPMSHIIIETGGEKYYLICFPRFKDLASR